MSPRSGTSTADTGLRYPTLWRAIGWLGVAMIVALSLMPVPDLQMHVRDGDKLGHVAAYFAITFWFAQLAASRRALALRAAGFLALGAAMEVAQGYTSWRAGNDPWDMLANGIGVVAATALALTPARRLLAGFERRVVARARLE